MFHASAEGASEKFRVFNRGTAYDVIIFKFQGGAFAPLLTPMASSHAVDICTNEVIELYTHRL